MRAAELSSQPLTRPYWSVDRVGDRGRLVQVAGAIHSEDPATRAYVRCVRGLGKNADKPHYTVAADGETVRDNRTELTWERKPQNRDWTYADAKAYGETGGRRLPTAKELMTIYDSERIAAASSPTATDPARDLSAFPAGDLPRACYWSSTDFATVIPQLPADTSYVTICEPSGTLSAGDKIKPPERTRVRCVL